MIVISGTLNSHEDIRLESKIEIKDEPLKDYEHLKSAENLRCLKTINNDGNFNEVKETTTLTTVSLLLHHTHKKCSF